MKKYFRICLALMLALTLFTGSVGVLALAEDVLSETPDDAPVSGESLNEGVPALHPYSPNYADKPTVFDYTKGDQKNVIIAEWIDVITDEKDVTAVTLKTANGHSASMTFQNINLNTNSSSPEAEAVAAAADSMDEGSYTELILDGYVNCDVQEAASPASAIGVRASSSEGGKTKVLITNNTDLSVGDGAQYCADPRSVVAESKGNGSITEVEIKGLAQDSIVAKSDNQGKTTVEHNNSNGIDGYVYASAANGSETTVKVEDDVEDYVKLEADNQGIINADIGGNINNYLEIKAGTDTQIKTNVGGSVKEDVVINATDANVLDQTNTTINGGIGGALILNMNVFGTAKVDINGEGIDTSHEALIKEGIITDMRQGSKAFIDVNGTVEGDVMINKEVGPSSNGILLNLTADELKGSLDVTAAGYDNIRVDIDHGNLTTDQDGVTVNNQGGKVNVDLSDNLFTVGGYGISVDSSTVYRWNRIEKWDDFDNPPENLKVFTPELTIFDTNNFCIVDITRGGTLHEDTETYTDDLRYEYSKFVDTLGIDIPYSYPTEEAHNVIIQAVLSDTKPNTVTATYLDGTVVDFDYKSEIELHNNKVSYKAPSKYSQDHGTYIDVNGEVLVHGDTKEVTGIDVNSNDINGRTEINIGRNLTVRSVITDQQPDPHATGIKIVNAEGDVDVNIEGYLDVSGGSGSQDTAIVIDRLAHDAFALDDSAEPVDVSAMSGESLGIYYLNGELTSLFKVEKPDGSCIYYDDQGRVYNIIDKAEKGSTKVRVGDDVFCNGTGIEFSGKGDEQTDIIIDGTLNAQGGPAVVLQNEEASIGDNLTLTVWKISPDKDGDFVKREVTDDQNQTTLVSDRASEQAIQYIMKISDDQTDVISTRGTTNFEGRNVAHEGDTVTLLINVPEGMAIDAVYGDKDNTKLFKNDEGQYFMVVPRGGGVYFSVTFCPWTPQEEITPKPDPEIKPVPQPEPQPAPKPEPKPEEPKPEPQPQADVKPADRTDAVEEQPRLVIVAPLMTIMDITNKMQLNFYPNKTFTAHIRDGRMITGKFMLIDDILTLVTSDNVRVPIAPDGTMNFIYGDECFSFIFNIDDLAKLRSLVM